MAAESFAHAAAALREADRDRYLSTLVLTGEARDAITALYAFNVDVASVRDRVNSPAPGEIRLQWWIDALEGDGHGDVRQNPVADALLQATERYSLPVGSLVRLVAARRFDLYDDPMPDLETFEGYAGETVSTLYQLAAMVLNGGAVVETGDAAGHLGVAHALIGHLRAFGYVSAQGRIMLPWSILAANGVTEGDVFGGKDGEAIRAALGQIGELAVGHLAQARAGIESLPASLKPAFASIAVLEKQLGMLDVAKRNPFEPAPDVADWRKIARLGWWAWRHR